MHKTTFWHLVQAIDATGSCERKKIQWEPLEETWKEAVKIQYYTFSGIIMVRSGTTSPLVFLFFKMSLMLELERERDNSC